MQVYIYPIAHQDRVVGAGGWVRGYMQAGMRRGLNFGSIKDAVATDLPGSVGFALSAFAFGYIAMTAKDMARGKTPRDLTKPETILAALMQSGGAGIFGDFFFDKANRFGNSFLETLGGPFLGEAARAKDAVSALMRGEFQDFGEDSLRLIMDNMPFVNLWYTREALNYLVLYHIREALSPGTLARTERRMKEEYGQRFLLSPSGVIKRGGGFR
jgi:hypothetical protein